MDIAIAAENLGKRYGNHQALAGVDLEVRSGTVLGLLGHNGAGKTTTIR
ncbi:ATP-binding cassette domain-containing protein, partial [Streptomyces sp. MCAF7]